MTYYRQKSYLLFTEIGWSSAVVVSCACVQAVDTKNSSIRRFHDVVCKTEAHYK